MNGKNEGKLPATNVNISSLDMLKCPCGSTLFGKVHEIRKLPALMSPTGKAIVVWIEIGSVCTGCGAYTTLDKINDMSVKVDEKKVEADG